MADSLQEQKEPKESWQPSLLLRIASAAFYAIVSLLMVLVNKSVLTIHDFPSFFMLGVGQMISSCLLLGLAKTIGLISFPELSLETAKKVWPLPLFYLGTMVFGLGGTKNLPLPMYTALRRFSILMTMIGEMLILKKYPTFSTKVSVFLIILGAVIAASDDLTFNTLGYSCVLLNDLFTASYAVCIKEKIESKDIGKYGLIFYNCFFMIPPAVCFAFLSGEFQKVLEFEGWFDPWFCFLFFLSYILGFLLVFSMVTCTAYNSPLTSTIVGGLKNIFITYFGVFFGGDYIYSTINFLGINISVLGTLVYTTVTFTEKEDKRTKAIIQENGGFEDK